MSEGMDAKLVCPALQLAYGQRKPRPGLLVHKDRGSQYASHDYQRLAGGFGIAMSMSRRANCWDSAAIESFFKTLKGERIYQVRYDTRAQARLDNADWIEGFYNRVRMHTPSGTWPPPQRSAACWLHDLVYVEPRQVVPSTDHSWLGLQDLRKSVRLAGSTVLTDSENILDLRGHEFARSIRTYRAGGCPAIKPWSDGYWHRTTTTTPISSKYRPNPAAPPRSTQGSSA